MRPLPIRTNEEGQWTSRQFNAQLVGLASDGHYLGVFGTGDKRGLYRVVAGSTRPRGAQDHETICR